MSDYTPEQYAARLRAWSRGSGRASLTGALKQAAREGSDVIAGVSVGQFMRDAGAGAGPRSASDRGPLRIVQGTLARAVAAPDGQRGSIREITSTGTGVTLTMGVDLSVVPYARAQEKGADFSIIKTRRRVSIPARPYLFPAVLASRSRIATRARAIVTGSFIAHVGGNRGAL